jgi:predicted ATP-binding protein involved in virulence
MALTQFEVSNRGPIDHAACDEVPQIMVVAGPNGVGKSTLLGAILEFPTGQMEGETDRSYFAPHRSPSDQSITEVNLAQMNDVTARETFSVTHTSRGAGPRRLRNLFGTRVGGNVERSNNPKREADYLPYYEVKRRLSQLQRKRYRFLDQVYEEQNQVPEDYLPDFEEPFRNAVESILPGITFCGVEEEDNEYRLKFENRDGSPVEFDDLSSGEKDLIAQVFIAVEHRLQQKLANQGLDEPPKGDLLIIIDGPESYLHPRLQANFMDFVRDFAESNAEQGSRVQFIMCTHSRSIIDRARDDEAYFLVYPDQAGDDGNQLINSADVGSKLLEEITEELGSVLLSSGKDVLLVEGPTDRDVLNTLFPNLEQSVDVVPMEGKDRVVQDTLNKLIPELADQGIGLYGLVDRDRDLNLENDLNDNVQSLPATCMENLLLNSDAIYQSLGDSQIGITGLEERNIEGSEGIEEIIDGIIESDDFKRAEVSKRWNESVNPINVRLDSFRASDFDEAGNFLESVVQSRVKEANSEEDIEGDVDRIVQNRNYSRVDGKEVLHRLSSRFNVSTDKFALSVANKIRERNEIPDALQDFVDRIS